MVNITLRVLSKPREEQLPTIFKVLLGHAASLTTSSVTVESPFVTLWHDWSHKRTHCCTKGLWHRRKTPAWLMLQNLGTDWDERVLPSIGNEIVKAVVARYNAEQLLTQRDKVSKAVGTLSTRYGAFYGMMPGQH
jgi:hypothetical protein